MSMPRLLAIDIDGTLARRDGSVAPEDVAALDRVRAAGIAVTLVTGRLYSGSRAVAHATEIAGPIACVDGCHIVDVQSGVSLFHRVLSGAHAAKLRDVLARHGLVSFLFARDEVVHDPGGDPYAAYVGSWSSQITRVGRILDHPAWTEPDGLTAVLALAPDAAIEAASADVRHALGVEAYVVAFPISYLPGKSALIVRALGPSKGTAITWLAEHHGCTAAAVVAVGDWWNDLPMFAVAGRSFVMGSAPDPVKNAASDRLDARAGLGGGVAEAVRKVWGI